MATRRLVTATASVVVASTIAAGSVCAQPRAPFDIDAAGRSAVVDRSWELQAAPGDTIGILRASVRCGDEMFISDSNAKVRRLNLTSGAQGRPIGDGTVMPMSIAVDCPALQLAVVSPPEMRREPGLSLVTFDITSGATLRTRQLAINTPPAPVAHVVGGEVVLGVLSAPATSDDPGRRASTGESMSDRTLALNVPSSLGDPRPAFRAYSPRCVGGSACYELSFDRFTAEPRSWLVTMGGADGVGIYDSTQTLTRTIPLQSSRFVRTGRDIGAPATPSALAQWPVDNSRIYAAYAIEPNLVAVVFYRHQPGQATGQHVRRDVHMNVYSLDGRGLVSDIALPEVPIGHDDHSLYVVDYGPTGRQGAADSVRLLRIPVRRDASGFK